MLSCPQCGTVFTIGQQYCASCGFPIGSMGDRSDDTFIGKTLPGGYHVLDLISVGGMGRVYRAEQSLLGRTVAVKVIHPHLLSDENSAARFLTEARAASQLNHPNSIAVFDFGRTDDGQPYIVMEFLRGKDLARVAYEEGPLPFTRIVNVLRQVLAALGEAHDLEIVHRDLKPENVILEPLRRGGDFVKVLDFGLAKLQTDSAGPNVTSPGIVCGTPDYMAPEQGRGDPIDGRSDLYAVGVVLFQLLTGRLPFEAESPTQVVMMHLSIPVPDPRQVAPERGIPPPLVDVTLRALEKNAEKRFQDAQEFSDALGEALDLATSKPPASLASVSTLAVCPTCGSTVPSQKFCGECGSPLGPGVAAAATAGERPGLPLPLVGREEELVWLDDRRREAHGRAIGARIVGESGAGKTRLLNEFLNRAEADGDLVVRARPDPYWAEVAYSSLKEVVSELTGLSEQTLPHADLGAATVEARRGLAEIFRGIPAEDDRRSPMERRNAIAEALRWAVERCAAFNDGRVVLAVDEYHRIDPPSRQAIADVLADPPECSLLVVAAHVPHCDPQWGPEHTARVLPGLAAQSTVHLLRAFGGMDRIRDLDTAGRGLLPMYIEQVVRFTEEVGGEPPSRLADLLAARFDVLDQSGRQVLQALAVLGDRVEIRLLAKQLPKTLELEPILDTLERAGFVERNEQVVSTGHPLIRELVMLGIPAAVRRDLHTKALKTWERRGAPLEARAIHAYYAEESFAALLLLEQVAARAGARGDLTTEVLALRRGLELARQEISRGELDDPLQAMLIFGRKLGSALTRSGMYSDAEGVLREILDIAAPSSPDRARVLGALAQVARGRQREPEALGYIEQAIEAAKQSRALELLSTLEDTRSAWVS